jgi:anti-anti-sigma factor
MFDVRSQSGVCIIAINSDLDIANAHELESAIALAESASERPIIVSLSECPYCDSSGLAVFVRAKQRLGAHFRARRSAAE